MIPYRPEQFTDFSHPSHSSALSDALAKIRSQLGRTYPLLVGGKAIETDEKLVSFNPSKSSEKIGLVSKANQELAVSAIESAAEAFKTWSRVPAQQRAELVWKAAAGLRRRKHEFNAWLMLEAGKNKVEADVETAEAIDFLEYYARQMIELGERGRKELVPLSGERNELQYIPLGVGVIIPPWNFPLAILAGMTVAALVAGNTVVLKPSSQTPVIGAQFVSLLIESGFPPEVISFVPGSGSEIGDTLVEHPLTRFISFTGSREVGIRIQELASRVVTGQVWIKRFIGELGGKDAILVDEDADLEAAAKGIVAAAFGFSGQKCSACSRVIAHDAIYDQLLARCAELTEGLRVGDSTDFASDMGPVIDSSSYNKILEYIEIGAKEGRLVTGGAALELPGHFIQPTIIADVDPSARIMQEEIFGPVLAFARCATFQEGLAIANGTEYGLTGSVYTRNREHIAKAKAEFHVGNLYFNRKCTGAMVGVHPFGGFNMSGTDSKAGGPDYLLLFTQPKVCSELL